MPRSRAPRHSLPSSHPYAAESFARVARRRPPEGGGGVSSCLLPCSCRDGSARGPVARTALAVVEENAGSVHATCPWVAHAYARVGPTQRPACVGPPSRVPGELLVASLAEDAPLAGVLLLTLPLRPTMNAASSSPTCAQRAGLRAYPGQVEYNEVVVRRYDLFQRQPPPREGVF
jgi:hypothetical protein